MSGFLQRLCACCSYERLFVCVCVCVCVCEYVSRRRRRREGEERIKISFSRYEVYTVPGSRSGSCLQFFSPSLGKPAPP